MKRIVTYDNATGRVLEVYGPTSDDTELEAVAGRTRVDAPADDGVDYSIKTWNGDVFEDVTPPAQTRLTKLDFRSLFTALERKAVRDLVRANDDDVTDAWEAMQLAEYVDLADPRVAGYLTLLVSKDALTVQRRAAILAGQVP